MSRLLKVLLIAAGGIVALIVVAAIALLLFFDPNDYRDKIEAAVHDATGRELAIEGDLSLSIFPWLAVEVGQTTLGNAAGFGDESFARFTQASLSVRLLPLILHHEIAVGSASLDGLVVNLAVNRDGVSNWDDLAGSGSNAPAAAQAEPGTGLGNLDIAGVSLRDATVHYSDAAAGSRYTLEHLTIETGRIAFGDAFDVSGEFDFSATPGDLGGHVALSARTTLADRLAAIALDDLTVDGDIRGLVANGTKLHFAAPSVNADLDNSRLNAGDLDLTVFGLAVKATVQPFSWAGDIVVPAHIEVSRFSLKELLGTLDIEPPVTADPAALERVAFSADAAVSPDALALKTLALTLDDTKMTGDLLLPLAGSEPIRFDLAADRIDLDRYMAPATDAPAADTAASDDFEIPVDTIRNLSATGNVTLAEAMFSGMTFTNLKLGLNSAAGKLRLHPLSAELFDGTYEGDVQVDTSGKTPSLSFDEHVADVSLSPLAEAMFEQDNLTGTIRGNFAMKASGKTLADMRRKLNGKMSFELADGAWQGTDLWYQLRRARALYRQEAPPEAKLPAQTEFTSIAASGNVSDGVFTSDDLLAELPFLRLTGNGMANLVSGEVDYKLQARVLERPEFVSGASDDELKEFTEALIPVRIRGTFDDLSVRPDIEAMFRKEVEDTLHKKGDELKQRLLDRLAGDEKKSADAESTDEQPTDEKKSAEDELKDKLKNLFEN